MAKIGIEIHLNKEKYLFGKDLTIDGTILLPGIDISTIESITVNHIICTGILDKSNKEPNISNHSSGTIVYTQKIPTTSLSFSIPLICPNITENDGISFDEYNSYLENQLQVIVKEKSILTLSDSLKILIPIEWEGLHNEKYKIKDISQYTGEQLDIKDQNKGVLQLESMTLPWDNTDIISKTYYQSVLANSEMARLGNLIYTNAFFKILRFGSYILIPIICGFALSNFENEFISTSNLWMIFYALFIYLFLQSIPKSSLKNKVIPNYPILNDEDLEKKLRNTVVGLKDFFLPYKIDNNSPLISMSGNIRIHILLSFINTYGNKNCLEHTQGLLETTLISERFSSLDMLFADTEIQIPLWLNEVMNIGNSLEIGFRKTIFYSITYDTLPDEKDELFF